jgi:hypothetical protein
MQYRTELQDGAAMDFVGEPRGDVVSGKPYSFTTWSNIDFGRAEFGKIHADGSISDSQVTVYCIGKISYDDSGGTQRETGFCWIWERKKWARLAGNSYDYAYCSQGEAR